MIREHGDLHSPRRCSPVAEYVEYEGGVEIMLRIQVYANKALVQTTPALCNFNIIARHKGLGGG